jgi:mannose-6-phosphate isomerase-like protein (cupin superfamily)
MTLLDKPIRRIVTIDDAEGRSKPLSIGPVADISRDPARPGYASSHIWATGINVRGPGAPIMRVHHAIEPPSKGSVCRIVAFPPDAVYAGKVGAKEVGAFFAAAGSPAASTYSPKAPHPYMQKTRTLDFCLVLEGRITLVLDTQEVDLEAGDTVIQRGVNHAWSNRSSEHCVIAFTLIDAASEGD